MLIDYKLGQGSIVCRVFLQDSSATTGAGLTGLTNASSGLIISTIADNEASATAYTVAGSTVETITTLGTYAAPTATKCRFKEVDATNHKGIYEVQIADARYAVSSSKSLLISFSGATNLAIRHVVIPLRSIDPYNAVTGGITALPSTACTGNASLLTSGTGTDQLSVTTGRVDVGKALGTAVTLDTNNVLNVSAKYLGGTLQTARDIGTSVLLSSGTGTGQISLSSGAVLLQATQTGVTIPNVTTVTTVTNQLTAAAIATGVWQDTTSGDFTTASSIGKSLYTSGAVPGAAGGLFIAGTNAATTITTALTTTFTGNLTGSVGSVTGAVGSVTGAVGSVTGAVGSITGVTFPTNFSSFSIDASGRIDIAKIRGTASAGAAGYVGLDWGNITAPTTTVALSGTTVGTATTVTNQLTAAAIATGVWQDSTSGDFTTASSIGKALYVANVAPGAAGGHFIAGTNAATTITTGLTTTFTGNVTGSVGSVTGAVGSVTGNVGGNVVGSVASVTAAVSLSTGDSPVIVSGTASAGGASTLTLTGASATDHIYEGCHLKTTGGTGTGQVRTITGYVGSTKVATVDHAWTTTPDNTTTFAVLATNNAKLDSSLQVTSASVQGNVTGSVGSVTGAVGSVTGSVGSVTGSVGSVTGAVGSVSGNVGGNVVGSVGSLTTNNDKTGYTLTVTPPTAATIATTVWTDLLAGSDFSTASSIGKLLKDDINVALSTLSTYAGGDTSGTTTLLSRLTSTRAGLLDNLDAAVTTRMATFTLPTNFADLAITATTGRIDVGKILGTTSTGAAGYVGLDWGQVTNKTTTNALTGTTISTSQAVASVSGAVGSVTGAVGSVTGNVGGNVVGSVASVTAAVTVGGYSSGQDPATLVLDTAASGHNTSLTIGNKINAAASAGDPWSTAVPGSYGAGTAGAVLGNLSAAADPWGIVLPGSYGAGTAGKIIGDNLDTNVGSRSTYAGADTSGTTTLLSRLTSTRAGLLDNLDAAISTRSTYAGGDTSGTTTLLSRLTGTRATNLDFLDTAVSGRMATFTVPTNFADLAITASTGRVTAGTVSDKTGYSLSQSFPTNFADLAITAATGRVTAGTVSDKTGYSLSQAFPSNFGSLTINSGGGIDLYSIGTDASAAVGLKAMGQGSIPCTVKSSPTSGSLFSIQAASGYTLSNSDGFYSTPDASLIVCTSGANKGKTAKITGYTGSTGALTLSPGFPATPTANDEMFIIGFSN